MSNPKDIRKAQVRKLHAQGLSDWEIAKAIDVHPTTVGDIRRVFGLKPNLSRKPVNKDVFMVHYNNGLCDKAIGIAMGHSQGTISAFRLRLKLRVNKESRRKYDYPLFMKLYKQELSDLTISIRMGITKQQVKSIRMRLKLPQHNPEKRRWTATEIARVVQLKREGYSIKEIARLSNRTFEAVKFMVYTTLHKLKVRTCKD